MRTSVVKENRKPAGTVEKDVIPQPYREWNHPYMTWLDVLVSLLFAWLMPVSRVCKYPPTANDDETREALVSLRKTVSRGDPPGLKQGLRQWRSKSDGELVQVKFKVQRHVNILVKWGIVNANDPIMKKLLAKEQDNNETVEVTMRFPLDLLPPDHAIRTTDNRDKVTGCIIMDESDLDWKLFSVEVPIMIYTHGGALVSGGADDGLYMQIISSLLDAQMTKTESDKLPPMIVMSIDYRLAPEHAFPAAHVDTLAVLDHVLLNTSKGHGINLFGISAGSLLGIFGCLQAHRKDAGRVKSCMLYNPYLMPSADTRSYYMCSRTSTAAVDLSRWGWQACLQLEPPPPEEESGIPDMPMTLDTILAKGSNRTAWNNCKWKQHAHWERLANPVTGAVPPVGDMRSSPIFVIGTAKADPLHDEGVLMAEKLKSVGHHVTHVDSLGTHCIGFMLHSDSNMLLVEAWRSAVWDDRPSSKA